MISTIGKKLVNLQGLRYTPPIWVNFGPETAENGWRVYDNPLSGPPHIFALCDTLARVI